MEKAGRRGGPPVGEIGEQALKGRGVPVQQAQIEPGVSHADDAAQDKIEHGQDHQDGDDIEDAAHEEGPKGGRELAPGGVDRLPRDLETGLHAVGIHM